MESISGNIVDIHAEKIFQGVVHIEGELIHAIEVISEHSDPRLPYILPGFTDSHVHIESSMLVPSEFARLAVVHGTVATVSDPHEIANVCGSDGVRFMIDNGSQVNFKFCFGAPSCVPATTFETSGAVIDAGGVRQLLSLKEIPYLSEMMNFPGVINEDPDVMAKIAAAKALGKPVDGHAPGLRGEGLRKYVAAGISTDHECFTELEAREKLGLGMKILIREGSAARNFEALIGLLHEFPEHIMFCSDDKHPDSLVNGHINSLCARAVNNGIPLFNILRAACINPVLHYGLSNGLLRQGDHADFITVDNLQSFGVTATYIRGICVARDGTSLIKASPAAPINRFQCNRITPESLSSPASTQLIDGRLPVIEAIDGELITRRLLLKPTMENGQVVSDADTDVLKIVVVNRYQPSAPAIAFIKNFGIRHGALASSVAHDSHNIIAVGSSDQFISTAVNMIIDKRGGISAVSNEGAKILALPVAGLMSADDGYEVASAYTEIDAMAKSMGSPLSAPFMTLSFMALLVIPALKLSDLGLFDGEKFEFVKLKS
jgi:adenine deaminase